MQHTLYEACRTYKLKCGKRNKGEDSDLKKKKKRLEWQLKTARYSTHLKQAEEHIVQSVVLKSVKNESDNSDNVSK